MIHLLLTGAKVLITKIRYGRHVISIGAQSRLGFAARIHVNNRDGVVSIGAGTLIFGEILTFGHGGRISIGDNCFVGDGCHIWSAENIEIGNRVLISHNVNIFDNLTHPISANARHMQFVQICNEGQPEDIDLGERPIQVEDDVLIGCNAIILRGVRVGRGAIIGAGSVVTKDVPSWTIVAGNPACVIREIPENER